MNNDHLYIAADDKGFKNNMLDFLLALGYYRMQHFMFTCNHTVITEDGKTIPVFWLRTVVNKCLPEKNAINILKKCSGFSVNIQQAYVDDDVESLYTLYKQHVPFTVSDTCADYLHTQIISNPFDSMMVKVFDRNELIAAGFFDKGLISIAGIMNMYHPQYRGYSLGKFLMLQKLQYALSNNMMFYYTGYISTESTRFDYKTFPDTSAVEVLLPVEKEWVPYHLLNKAYLADYYKTFLTTKEI